MKLDQLLADIDSLKASVDSYKPLNAEQEARLLQKLRLDWNYHSNHIEGNRLSYGETKNLLLFGITARGKPLKDHLEIQGHDQAIEYLLDHIKQPEQEGISQTFIRNLHKLILTQDSEIPARTPDGAATTRKIHAGVYKTQPNHVLTATGKIFYFATPEETPAKMTDLVDWLRGEFQSRETHPLLVAAEFHYRFVRIHPFDDGNGRMARLSMNFILMMYGFPPLIVPTEEREQYLNVLSLSDEQEDITEFVLYVGQRLKASLELYIKAARGEPIEEPDDLDKAINLLKRKFPPKVGRTPDLVKNVVRTYSIPFFNDLIKKLEKFDIFFASKKISISMDGYSTNIDGPVSEDLILKLDMSNLVYGFKALSLLSGKLPPKEWNPSICSSIDELLEQRKLSFFTLRYDFYILQYEADEFNYAITVKIQFRTVDYLIDADAPKPRKALKLHYDSIVTPEEMEDLSTRIAQTALHDIEAQIDSIHPKT